MSTKSKITGFEIKGVGDNQIMIVTRQTETYIPSTLDNGYYTPARVIIGKKVHIYPLSSRRHGELTRAFDSVYGPPDIVNINIRYGG